VLTSWLTAAPPTVALEIASHRVTVVGATRSGGRTTVTALATEALPAGAVRPALVGSNVVDREAVVSAARRALDRAGLGSARRVALVVPDSIARVSLLPLEQIPARPQDLEQLLRWQMRKALPFPMEEAQVSHFRASGDGATTTMAAVVARRDVVAEYEAVAGALGLHAGVVDLASFNVMTTMVGGNAVSTGDWLLVHLAHEATTLAILRGPALLFYRHRNAHEEPLRALVHQTAMYHEDRLGGGAFAGVYVCGAGAAELSADAHERVRERFGVTVDTVDVRSAATFSSAVTVPDDIIDALAAPVGALLSERAA